MVPKNEQLQGIQTYEICLYVVKFDGMQLYYCNFQSDEICLTAVKQNPRAYAFVEQKYFTKEIKEIALKNGFFKK